MPKNPIYSDIIRKRERQVMLGMSTAHDDTFDRGEIVLAALAYALYEPGTDAEAEGNWPFAKIPFTPSDERRENLLTAAALIIAEIERGDRQHRQEQEGEDWKRADD